MINLMPCTHHAQRPHILHQLANPTPFRLSPITLTKALLWWDDRFSQHRKAALPRSRRQQRQQRLACRLVHAPAAAQLRAGGQCAAAASQLNRQVRHQAFAAEGMVAGACDARF